MENTCATCLYWHQTSCRRFPPQVVASNSKELDEYSHPYLTTLLQTEFPTTTADEWCGEHKDKAVDELRRQLGPIFKSK